MSRGLIAVALLAPAVAFAAAEKVWTPLVRGQVPAGEAKGAAPTSSGTIELAPEAKELAAPASPYLWSLAVAGDAVFAGSGDSGEVWRVPEDGSAAKAIHDAAETQAQVLLAADGSLFAGFNPGARVVRMKTDGSKVEPVLDAAEAYVWTVLPEQKGRALLVGVGSPGKVYRVEPGSGAAAKVVLDAGDSHVRSLAFAKDGRLLAGTDGRGLVVRAEKDGGRFVLFDAPRREISSISVAPDGTIWFAAVGAEEAVDASVAAAATAVASPTPAPPTDPKKGPAGQLYRMRPDGFSELVWTAPGPGIYAVLADGTGALVATGDPAAVWRIDADGVSRKVLDPSAGQATALLRDGAAVLVATANPSKVVRLSAKRKSPGVFESSALDAGGFARWGRLAWTATEPKEVELATRSGNTATPDASWSAWSKRVPSEGGAIASPPARYLQYRTTIEAGANGAEVSWIEAVYRVENRAPKVDSIWLEEPGVTLAPKADAPPSYTLPPELKPSPVRKELPQKRGYQRGWQAARWAASDPDGDALVYDVYLRGAGESVWRPLVRGQPESYTTWESASLPDGRYELRVVASDLPVNGAGSGLSGERLSMPFDVDSTPPRVDGANARREGKGLRVSFAATDAVGIAAGHVSVDGGDWIPLVAEDGLADSSRERFSALLPDPGPGEHVIVLRATDRSGNPGSGKAVVR